MNGSVARRGLRLQGLALALVLSGCAAGIHSHVAQPVAPSHHLSVPVLAVMPVTAEIGSEGLRPDFTEALMDGLAKWYPGVTLIHPRETARRLAESEAATEYALVLSDFARTGVVESSRLGRVADAVGADHFLQVRAAYFREEFLDRELFGHELDQEERQVVTALARIWTDSGPGPLWEASVETRSETDDFTTRRKFNDLVLELVAAIMYEMPLAGRRSE